MASRKRNPILIAGLALLAGVLIIALLSYDRDNPSPATADTHTSNGHLRGELPDAGEPNRSGQNPANAVDEVDHNGKNAVKGGVNEPDDVDPDVDPKEEQEAEPYTESNRPKLDNVRQLPIGKPRKPAPPEYGSNLADEDWRVYDRSPDPASREKLTRWAWGEEDQNAARRLVRGRVFEIVGNERIPLMGILVFGGGTRCFTDEHGLFEMMAIWSRPDEDERKQGITYEVELATDAEGYIDLQGRGAWYNNLDETGNGIELYVVRRDMRLIRIRFENPQVAGGAVTVCFANSEYAKIGQSVDWDEKRYIVAKVDPNSETSFSVPLRHNDAGESDYGLINVSAPNILADIRTIGPVSVTDEETLYVVRLLVEDTVTINGTATDMQTGKPIPHARVYGPGATEFTVADEHGSFELITSKTPRGPRGEPIPEDEQRYLHVSDERYATLTAEVNDSSLHADGTGRLMLGPGGNLSGPWTFQLRRWVEATVDCTFLDSKSRADAKLSLVYDVVDDLPDDSRREVNADGFCRFPRIPWGTETLRVSTRTPFAAREVEITPSSWSGSEPFQLRVKD